MNVTIKNGLRPQILDESAKLFIAHGFNGTTINEEPALSNLPQSKGAWGWAGGFGTNFNVEPAEQMVTVVFIQTPNGALQRDVETAIRQAIVD